MVEESLRGNLFRDDMRKKQEALNVLVKVLEKMDKNLKVLIKISKCSTKHQSLLATVEHSTIHWATALLIKTGSVYYCYAFIIHGKIGAEQVTVGHCLSS